MTIIVLLIFIFLIIIYFFIYSTEKFQNKKYVSCNYLGGLGNQLFGIYTTISYSIKNNKDPIFKNLDESPSCTKRNTYWNTLFKNLKTYNDDSIKWTNINENSDAEYDQINDNDDNIMFNGYFQSYHNFIDNINEINDIIQIKQQKNIIKMKYQELFNNKNIGIHFRLGDYKKFKENHPILNDNYYINALNKINLNYNILVFCEKGDYENVNKRMKYILSKVNTKNSFQIIKIDNEIEEMFILSLCDYIIIANSTYSWWAAVFSNHNNIYLPYMWFNDKTQEKLILPSWSENVIIYEK